METLSELSTSADLLEYFVMSVMDTASFQIAVLTKTLREEDCPVRAMEAMDSAKRGYMKIKRDGYIISDFKNYEINNGFYNIRDFLQDLCSGINSYLSGIFDVDIEYKIYDEDNVNINFDARLVEKAVYDAIFGLLCEAGVKNRRVSVYSRDLSKYIKICMRCEGASRNENKISERSILFSEYNEEGLESYAELAIKRLGGKYKCVYGKSDGKVELYIPKNLKISQMCMKESECKIVLGEKIMVHKMCDLAQLEKIFGALKARE